MRRVVAIIGMVFLPVRCRARQSHDERAYTTLSGRLLRFLLVGAAGMGMVRHRLLNADVARCVNLAPCVFGRPQLGHDQERRRPTNAPQSTRWSPLKRLEKQNPRLSGEIR